MGNSRRSKKTSWSGLLLGLLQKTLASTGSRAVALVLAGAVALALAGAVAQPWAPLVNQFSLPHAICIYIYICGCKHIYKFIKADIYQEMISSCKYEINCLHWKCKRLNAGSTPIWKKRRSGTIRWIIK